MHPAKFLKRLFGRRKLLLLASGDGFLDRFVVRESNTIQERLEFGGLWFLTFNRKADEVRLRLIDIKTD